RESRYTLVQTPLGIPSASNPYGTRKGSSHMTTDGAADTMKAVYFEETGGTDVLRFGDVPRPQPGNGQALVRVLACGVNRLDIYARTGRTPVKQPHTS